MRKEEEEDPSRGVLTSSIVKSLAYGIQIETHFIRIIDLRSTAKENQTQKF